MKITSLISINVDEFSGPLSRNEFLAMPNVPGMSIPFTENGLPEFYLRQFNYSNSFEINLTNIPLCR